MAWFVLWGTLLSVDSTIASQNSEIEITAQMGVGGMWKVGFPAPLRLEIQSKTKQRISVRVRSVDGDGVPIVYRSEEWSWEVGEGANEVPLEVTAQHGRSKQPIIIEVLDASGNRLSEHVLTNEERGEVLPAVQPWVVTVGGDLGLAQLNQRTAAGVLPNFSLSIVTAVDGLPRTASGYSGVDLLVIGSHDWKRLQAMQADQSNALHEWIRRGGKVCLSIGKNAKLVAETEWLAKLLPSKIRERVENVDPGPIETWVSSEKPMAPIVCAAMESASLTELQGLTPRRETIPLVIKQAFGKGQVTVFASDLESTAMAEWSDRGKLLDKLLVGAWKQASREAKGNDSIASFGYDDLCGQLRATLDVFANVQTANLTLLAALLAIFLLVIPFDYFVLTKAWKKPSWTWGSLFLCSFAFTLAIAWLAVSWKPRGFVLNQMTVWDFDQASHSIQGQSWMHLYAGQQGKVNLKATPSFQGIDIQGADCQLDWSGLPGTGLGGFESAVSADRGMPEYHEVIVRSNDGTLASSIEGMGIPQAGTKALQASWSLPWKEMDASTLGLVPGSDMLEGTWTNPLKVDLLDGAVLYRNWLYPLPTRFPSGKAMEFSLTSQPKDLARRLQRRRMVEGAERSVPWNPFERNELDRLGELLLFYKAAGGESYTSLHHRYLKYLDLSDHLRLDRAIVLARIQGDTLPLHCDDGSGSNQVKLENGQTWVRIMIPVITRTPKP